MPTTLRSANTHILRQRRLIVLALALVRRAFTVGSPELLHQGLPIILRQSASEGALSVRQMLDEQDIDIPGVGAVNARAVAESVIEPPRLRLIVDDLFDADDLPRLERLGHSLISDSGRVAAGVEVAQRKRIDYIRMVSPPCCARCAILAGQTYRYSTGFKRHPQCDCVLIPVTVANPNADLITDPMALFEAGQIKDLSQADQRAIRDGADLARVVNIRRSEAGLTTAGRVVRRGGKLTPEAIYQLASDQDDAIRLLKKVGYIR